MSLFDAEYNGFLGLHHDPIPGEGLVGTLETAEGLFPPRTPAEEDAQTRALVGLGTGVAASAVGLGVGALGHVWRGLNVKGIDTPSVDPATFARGMQGNKAYPGVDTYRNITLRQGTIVYGATPYPSNFYTTAGTLRRAENNLGMVANDLQLRTDKRHGLRPNMTAYLVTEDTPAAIGIVRANPTSYGRGGGTQLVVPNLNALQALREREMKR